MILGFPSIVPIYRALIALDIEGSTRRINRAKAGMRQVMYDLVEVALRMSRIGELHRDPLVDRGDGVLMLIHPVDQVPKTVPLNVFVPTLSSLLANYNRQQPDHGFRLRAALHAGEVHYDRRGPFGEAIDITCRLVDAPELKVTLEQTAAPLVMVVSDDIYRSVIRHGYDDIDDRTFEPLVQLDVGGNTHRGWIHLPIGHPHRQELDAPASVESAHPEATSDNGLRNGGAHDTV